MFRFVWDDKKSKINLAKYGISFEEAQSVFEDEEALVIFDAEHSEEEDRFLILGLSVSLKLLVVCHCYREDGEQIRILSARKATYRECKTYSERRNYDA